MSTITFKGNPIHTAGTIPSVGQQAADFKLTATDLSDKSLADYKGKKVVLNIFPSIDTGTCAASVRKFNQEAAGLENTVVLCISKDLPFAHSRFCEAEDIQNVETLSEYKNADFSNAYQLRVTDGPLEGLLSRAVIVLDAEGKVIHSQQVQEITEEPDYNSVLAVL